MAGFLSWLRAEWDRAAGVAFLVAGAVSLAVGYAGVADASYVPQALSFIASGGFFGLLGVAVGATLLITAALHDEWRKLDRIEKAIDRLAETGATVDLAQHEPANGRGSSTDRDPRARTHQATMAAGLVAAVGLVGAGWIATASAVADTTAYSTILLGITGLAVAGVASAGWTLSLRRSVRARQARLLAPFGAAPAAETTPGAGPGADARGRVAVAEGLTRFHASGCAAVAGLPVRLMDSADAARSGLSGCRLCQPGD